MQQPRVLSRPDNAQSAATEFLSTIRQCEIVCTLISEKGTPLTWLRTDAQSLEFAVQIPPEGDNVIAYQVPLLLVACVHHTSSSGRIGSCRLRFLVAAKIALHTAGAIGGVPGSPIPLEG